MLTVSGLTVRFGGLAAVDDVSFRVEEGEICGLIGPNGAGKTTAFNAISGIYQPAAGTIEIAGHRVDGLRPHQVTAQGVGRTFQNLGIFESMTVLESVLVGTHLRQRTTPLSALFRPMATARTARANVAWAGELLESVGLTDVRDSPVTGLPFGSLKRLELARALAGSPKVLLLDEPANGLSAGEAEELAGLLLEVKARFRLTIVVVEHHMPLVMAVTGHLVVMDAGRVIADGEPRAVAADPRVVEAYLGAAL
jgi:branched-chain amino acid transport system ATP-binding protein